LISSVTELSTSSGVIFPDIYRYCTSRYYNIIICRTI